MTDTKHKTPKIATEAEVNDDELVLKNSDTPTTNDNNHDNTGDLKKKIENTNNAESLNTPG